MHATNVRLEEMQTLIFAALDDSGVSSRFHVLQLLGMLTYLGRADLSPYQDSLVLRPKPPPTNQVWRRAILAAATDISLESRCLVPFTL